MTLDKINRLGPDELLAVMRREGIPPIRSLFATIHYESTERPSGFTKDDLGCISENLEDGDLVRWRRALVEHFSAFGDIE